MAKIEWLAFIFKADQGMFQGICHTPHCRLDERDCWNRVGELLDFFNLREHE
ncbi:hypothetical protein [Desulfosediminicola sp.]|uniref:hypothetical protein n=1 Tax=Desulfosediminicola sp. TaxID=2886825 RepID=UPI003AF24CF8